MRTSQTARLVALMLLVWPAAARAATVSVEASPPSTTGTTLVTVTIDGNPSANETFAVNAFPQSEGCPKTPRARGLLDFEGSAATLPASFIVGAPPDRGAYFLCATLFEGPTGSGAPYGSSEYSGVVIAKAEATLTVSASPAEVEAESARRSQEASVEQTRQELAQARAAELAAEQRDREELEAPAKEAARQAREADELRARELMTPIAELSIGVRGHRGHSSAHPGHSDLLVRLSPYAHFQLVLARHGHRIVAGTYETEGEEQVDLSPIAWSCRHPGAIEYTVRAETNAGPALTRTGTIPTVSTRHCALLTQREREARERSARQYAEERRAQARELHEGVERFDHNCEQEGGTPIRLEDARGEQVPACRSPHGTLLPFPE